MVQSNSVQVSSSGGLPRKRCCDAELDLKLFECSKCKRPRFVSRSSRSGRRTVPAGGGREGETKGFLKKSEAGDPAMKREVLKQSQGLPGAKHAKLEDRQAGLKVI